MKNMHTRSTPASPLRRRLLAGVGSAALAASWPVRAQQGPRQRLRLAGPMAAVSFPLLWALESGALAPLAEPAISMALRKTRSFPVSMVAPQLYRSVDLQQEWARVFQRPPEIAQAGVAAVGAVREDAALLAQVRDILADAHAWCQAHPLECGEMARRHLPLLKPQAVADSLQAAPAIWRTAAQARPDLEFFYTQLLDSAPALVGGKLLDDGFYF